MLYLILLLVLLIESASDRPFDFAWLKRVLDRSEDC